jgi:hypothetical protein
MSEGSFPSTFGDDGDDIRKSGKLTSKNERSLHSLQLTLKKWKTELKMRARSFTPTPCPLSTSHEPQTLFPLFQTHSLSSLKLHP